ncbi:MAG TPA: ATP-dependent sacrificial sulfur transferase LarE [Tepidisphaeraceae bacterium]|nr:ATP-dependent sacrificial sulfur transferase LarE [Tepidisphaeraceae bacterium]
MPSATSIQSEELASKYERLSSLIKPMGRVIVAFSGGVDSTLVLKAALDTLGRENVLAATGVSPSLPQRELQSVKDLAAVLSAPLELIETSEMESPDYTSNPSNRCYYCKTELYSKLTELAAQKNYSAILNGLNLDDTGDHRPGMSAAKEWHIRSPLLEARLSKSDVRALAEKLHLPNWEKPALACLSSRIPYGTPVTIQSLWQIEKAEDFLRDLGFSNVRVRHHSTLARIEVDADDLSRLLKQPLRSNLIKHFKQLGYTYVTLDLQGFRSGSGNETLTNLKKPL